MKHSIYSAFKHFALSAAIRALPHRKRTLDVNAPEPRRQPNEMGDAWMFDKAADNAVEHRMSMLANEMDRLSGTLSGLRAFLGSVATDAPMLVAGEPAPLTPPMISDRDLFDGEPLAAIPNAVSTAGEVGFLFEEEILQGQNYAQAETRAQAA